MLNHVVLQGYLGGPAEIKPLDSGGKVARMHVATTRAWKNDSDEWEERTAWVRIVTFREGLIDHKIAQKAVKGAPVVLTGELRSNQFEDKDGNRHYVLEVHVGLKHEMQFPPRLPKEDMSAEPPAADAGSADPATEAAPAATAGA